MKSFILLTVMVVGMIGCAGDDFAEVLSGDKPPNSETNWGVWCIAQHPHSDYCCREVGGLVSYCKKDRQVVGNGQQCCEGLLQDTSQGDCRPPPAHKSGTDGWVFGKVTRPVMGTPDQCE